MRCSGLMQSADSIVLSDHVGLLYGISYSVCVALQFSYRGEMFHIMTFLCQLNEGY